MLRSNLGQVQTPFFTWAESNANEKNPMFSLISIRFDSCEVRRLNLALEVLEFSFIQRDILSQLVNWMLVNQKKKIKVATKSWKIKLKSFSREPAFINSTELFGSVRSRN